MTDSGAGSSLMTLRGILKNSHPSDEPELLVHNPDCPLSCQSLSQLQCHLSLGSNSASLSDPSMPLKGILRTSISSGVTETQKDCNSSKFRKRQRWDEGNILATSCHSWLMPVSGSKDVKPGPHLCSVTMLDGGAGTSTSGEQICLCISKRKKSQSWNEMSIMATQPPYTDNPWMKADDGFTASVAWQSLSLRDDTGPSHSTTSTSYSQPPWSPLKPGKDSSASNQYPNRNQLDQPKDTSQHGMMGPSKQATEAKSLATEESADIDLYVRPSFEQLRKAHFREDKEVLLARRSIVEDDDEDDDTENTDYTVPKLNYCSCTSSGGGYAAPMSKRTQTVDMAKKKTTPSDK
ncbi:uncharacterized protein LOC115153723 [Salmo trutta]|uniref:uncharacterized protein LOC115153723 n=1 Tax=Salmo trutta TaxID=8032 RepID=UPI0011311AF6|nr:uncharacterized protein LOC115153723 [Salmo trutta]